MVRAWRSFQNFSKVARLVDRYGSVVIMKNNAPRYIIYEFSQADALLAADGEDVPASSEKLLGRNAHVYKELAKGRSSANGRP